MTEWSSFFVRISGVIFAGLLMIFLGKYDHQKKLAPWLKLFLQSMIALLVIAFGVKIEFLRDSSGGYWYLTNLSIPATIFWLLIITNSVGQTDGLGDITPVIVLIASSTFLIVSILQKQSLFTAEILSLILIIFSAIIIYLKKNSHKKWHYFSSYYMFFGFMLAVIAIVGVVKSTAALTLLTPLLILGFPIVDTSYSFIANYLTNNYLGTLNESKLRQQLIEQGFSWKGANMIIISASIYLSMMAIMISIKEDYYLFTAMTGIGYLVFLWLKQRVSNGSNVICCDASGKKVFLFGVPINRINCQQVLEYIDQFINKKQPHVIITPDTLAILRARKDRQYLEITQQADLVTPDGAGILWATAMLEMPLAERITGIDLINYICQIAVQKNYRVYLLGAKKEVVKKAGYNLKIKYPGINIVGSHHGYFNESSAGNGSGLNEEERIINEIKEKRPDFLLVGMGVPKQEFWIFKHKDELEVPVCIGIGGSFDVLSGNIPRAPLWMRKHGMEWMFRLWKEPKRIKRAIFLPYFMWLILLGRIELFFREIETFHSRKQ